MILDCFMFFNELDVLEIRLNVLSETVDQFVLVESRHTHQGRPKPLYFAEHRSRFANFDDRIHHVVVDQLPTHLTDLGRERFHRDAIRRGLGCAKSGDTVLISDVDEIPNPEQVTIAAERDGVTVFRHLLFSYFLNYQHLRKDGQPGATWGATVAYRHGPDARPANYYRDCRYLPGAQTDPLGQRMHAALRRVRRSREPLGTVRVIDNAGWHFSYLGGADAIVTKLESFLHSEYNLPEFKSREAINDAIANKRDLFGRPGRYAEVPIDERFPGWIRTNAHARYSHLITPSNR